MGMSNGKMDPAANTAPSGAASPTGEGTPDVHRDEKGRPISPAGPGAPASPAPAPEPDPHPVKPTPQ